MTRPLSVLVGCEYSGTVRDAFLALGHDAWSNDILAAESRPDRHMQGDILEAIFSRRWDRIIIHIPCTEMAVCGNRHHAGTQGRLDAIEWSLLVWDAACMQSDHVAMENPASVLFPALRTRKGADVHYVQPWMFGHPEQKRTGFATRGLPRLVETNNVYEHMMTLPRKERERIFHMSPGADRGKERARFYPGLAAAMADQWGLFNVQ